MKQALLAALEPLLLLRARKLSRELPAERRPAVQRLWQAARSRQSLARDVREPESLPAALTLGREAFALSVSALLAARGKLEGPPLAAAAAFSASRELAQSGAFALPASSELETLMTTSDPAYADGLGAEALRNLQRDLERLMNDVQAGFEARTPRRVALLRGVRFGFVALGLVLVAVWLSMLAATT